MNNPFDWELFIRDKSKKLFHYVLKLVYSAEDAEDIVQNSLIALLKNTHKLDQSHYERWLYRVAYNKSMNLLKRNKSILKKTDYIVLNYNTFTLDEYVNEDDIKRNMIRKCFTKLKEKHALALELQFYQKKSYKEIADIMGITSSAVDSLLVRAKKEMKNIMQEKEMKNIMQEKE